MMAIMYLLYKIGNIQKIFKNVTPVIIVVAKTNRLYDDVVVKLPIIIQVKNCL